jgi:hypothetical protein
MRTFAITPDGKQIVFDRLRENADIVLIDLPILSAPDAGVSSSHDNRKVRRQTIHCFSPDAQLNITVIALPRRAACRGGTSGRPQPPRTDRSRG